MNTGIPEIVVALLLIGLPVWLARRFPVSEKVFPYMLVVLAVLLLVFFYNYATTFRTVN